MDGTLAGTDSWFANPASQVSAHYGVGLDGTTHQYVHVEDAAWANGVLEPGDTWPGPRGVNPNNLTVSIETEDLGNASQPVTDAQFDAVLALGRQLVAAYPSIKWLCRHTTISPRSRPDCPGIRWTWARFTPLAEWLGLEPV